MNWTPVLFALCGCAAAATDTHDVDAVAPAPPVPDAAPEHHDPPPQDRTCDPVLPQSECNALAARTGTPAWIWHEYSLACTNLSGQCEMYSIDVGNLSDPIYWCCLQ